MICMSNREVDDGQTHKHHCPSWQNIRTGMDLTMGFYVETT